MSGGHAERKHALLGASKAAQWLACPPSARLQESVEEKRSGFADQGTAAHEYSEILLRCYLSGKVWTNDALREEFEKTSEHFDEEMRQAIAGYVDFVVERYHEALERSADAVMLLEEQLDFSDWVPEGFGTGDVIIISDGVMEIIDLKYGKGVLVSAINNAQLKLYALGAWTAFNHLYDIEEVIMTIVQPRIANGTSSDRISVADLTWWAETEVRGAAELAFKGEGEFSAGEHCRWCKVKGNCRARSDANMALLAHEFKEPALLSLDEIGPILTIAENLASWAKDVQQYAFDAAVKGQAVPGWKLVEGRSNRTIQDKELAIQTFAQMPGIKVDQYLKPHELLGIGELEKRIGKKKLTELIGGLIVKPPGKPVLVVEADKRQPLNSVEGDFGEEDFGDD